MTTQPTQLVGHALCANGGHTWVIDEIARATGGLCSDCFTAQGCKRIEKLEIISRGARILIPLRTPTKRRHRPNKPKSKDAEKAKERAQRRLAKLFPDLYFQLVAEERAAAGLKPWTVPMALQVGGPAAADATLEFAEQLGRRVA